MKKLLLLLTLAFCNHSFAIDAPIDIAQSSPDLNWYSIENNFVRVIYPDSMKSESVYIANLIENYSHVVGKTYGIEQPALFNLIIRPEMAEPNGYVTLGPRRSEWFSSSMFFPLVGTTEWYQTLSIHEYRHVNQFDHLKTGGVKILYYIMGEAGWGLGAALVAPSWYLEGDAVWAETKYTDGGRGRSPRFTARLKALVLSDKIPTYDQFLSGSYKTEIPNQYIYGYTLVSYAVHKFGEDIWRKIIEEAAGFPYPTRFYNSFEVVTGQNFEDFYNEAMQDLKTKWSADLPLEKKWTEYREASAPFKVNNSLYYVKQTLDTHAQMIRHTDQENEVVFEFPYNKELQVIDVNAKNAVFTEFLPDKRYAHKGSSDLVIADLNTGSQTQITSGQRLYNPRFNADGTKIITTEFKANQTWAISEFNLDGKLLNTVELSNNKVAESFYLNNDTAVSIINNKSGQKYIATVDLKNRKILKVLVPPSRNLLNSLYVDKNKNIFFEAQYKGYNEIFKLTAENNLSQCTKSKIGAYTPSSDGENLYLSDDDTNGSTIKSSPLSSCKNIAVNEIVNFNYLGKTASDDYNNFPIQTLANQDELATKNEKSYKPKKYGDFDSRLFIPHSWGLTLGRGSGIGFETDNYLRTLSFAGLIGADPEEGGGFAELNFDIKKYDPLIRVQVENRNRDVKDFSTEDRSQWLESTGGVSTIVPYIKKSGLYNFVATVSSEASFTNASKYKFNDADILNVKNDLYKMGVGTGFMFFEDAKARSLISSWLISYNIRYEDAEAKKNSDLSSYRVLQKAQVNTPGLFKNDGLMFTLDEQRQKESTNSYRFLPESTAFGYTFSRGYSYRDAPYYQKLTGNYVFPVAYPDFNLGRWYYLKQISSTLFFDSTFVKNTDLERTLNSYGLEVLFESTLLRLVPITIGGRVYQKLEDNKIGGEMFLSSGVGF